jgi:hypothetical protein
MQGGSFNSTAPHVASHFWVAEQFVDGGGEKLMISLIHKQTGHIVNHIVSKPPYVASYDGDAAGSGF